MGLSRSGAELIQIRLLWVKVRRRRRRRERPRSRARGTAFDSCRRVRRGTAGFDAALCRRARDATPRESQDAPAWLYESICQSKHLRPFHVAYATWFWTRSRRGFGSGAPARWPADDLRAELLCGVIDAMRAVIQRVSQASVTIDGLVKGSVDRGLLVLLGVEDADTAEDVEWLAGKIVRLRVFADEAGLMNRSVQEIGGGVLVVSQFTLFASTRKGNRPSFTRSARPEVAVPLYEAFVQRLGVELGQPVATGEFGALMQVALVNDGPVTIVIDTRARE